jgi:hypothetical protein
MEQASSISSAIRTHVDPDLLLLRTVRTERTRSIPSSVLHNPGHDRSEVSGRRPCLRRLSF